MTSCSKATWHNIKHVEFRIHELLESGLCCVRASLAINTSSQGAANPPMDQGVAMQITPLQWPTSAEKQVSQLATTWAPRSSTDVELHVDS